MECPLPVANPDKFWIKCNDKKKLYIATFESRKGKSPGARGNAEIGS